MFFKKRTNPDSSIEQLQAQLAAFTDHAALAQEKLSVLDSLQTDVRSLLQTTGQLESRLDGLHSDVHKHDMAIEDLLDEWDEKKSDEKEVQAQLQEASQTETLLLSMFETYQEQFWSLRHYADSNKDEAWAAQLALMEKTLERCRRSCAIDVIQDCGVSVDYQLHDVIEAVECADPALDKTVAEVYRCGYLYKGKVRKKARIAAYKKIK